MSCLAKGCLDEDRETAEKENAPAQKRLDPQRDNENGHDRHEEEGCCGESGIGEEHAEEYFGDIYDNAHCAISIDGRRSTDAVMRPTPRNKAAKATKATSWAGQSMPSPSPVQNTPKADNMTPTPNFSVFSGTFASGLWTMTPTERQGRPPRHRVQPAIAGRGRRRQR